MDLPSAGLPLDALFHDDTPINLPNPFDESPFPQPIPPPAPVVATDPTDQVMQEDVAMEEGEGEHDAGLFGSDDEEMDGTPALLVDSVPELATQDENDQEQLSESEQARRNELEYPEPEGDPTSTEEQTIAEITILANPIPTQSKVWHARLPNFLALETKPFEKATWVPPVEVEEEDSQGAEEGEKKAPVPDENVIRWRWGKDAQGKPIPQANSRIVEWSDGSLSLQIGTELFDITASLDASAPITALPPHLSETKPPLPNASNTPSLTDFDPARGHGLTYVTSSNPCDDLIEMQASVHGTLTFRPTTLQSKTHRLLAGNIAGRYVKGRAMKQALTSVDPERKKAEMEKAVTDKARKLARAKNGTSSGGKKKRRSTRLEGVTDDEDDEEEGEDIGGGGRRSNPKRGKGGALSREEVEESEDDDGFVVDSDDEETTGRRARGGNESDEMEFIEAKLDRDAERRKAQKKRRESGREESPVEPVQVPKRRLVIESDEDEE